MTPSNQMLENGKWKIHKASLLPTPTGSHLYTSGRDEITQMSGGGQPTIEHAEGKQVSGELDYANLSNIRKRPFR